MNPEIAIFEKYIANRKILIADPSASSRSGLFKILQDLGAKSNLITLVNSFKLAEDQIQMIKPHIVIAEYELDRKCGLDLLQGQRVQRPTETKESLFVVVTGNTSQTAVAKAAEEDIDAYIIKPFTPEVVRNVIMKAALAKINPSTYSLKIEEGKGLLNKGEFDAAEAIFLEATKLDSSPSLAFYYLGQTKFIRKIMEQAQGSYTKGLEFNKIHYKCLIGLYELLMSQKNTTDAYEVVKKVSQYFPANPKRLGEVLRLAIVNAKYEDVEKYYQIFCNIDERDDTLIKYICAALVVCGRHYLNIKQKNRALELFTKASATGTGRVKILREIVQALIDFELAKDARTFVAKFPAESQAAEDYLIMKFKVTHLEGNKSLIINDGLDLIKKGYHDKEVYEFLLQRMMEAKQKMGAESTYHDAISKYPDHKNRYDELFKQSEAA